MRVGKLSTAQYLFTNMCCVVGGWVTEGNCIDKSVRGCVIHGRLIGSTTVILLCI